MKKQQEKHYRRNMNKALVGGKEETMIKKRADKRYEGGKEYEEAAERLRNESIQNRKIMEENKLRNLMDSF